METTTQVGDTGNNDPDYLLIALAAGIPCGVIILVLAVIIVFMVCLTFRRSSEQDQVEATYMQRRFQGLSLAEQRRMEEQKRKKKRRFSRRRSSAAESKASSTKLTPNTRRAKVRRVNPFGLQDWQLRMSGIEPETEETDIDGEEESEKTVGAYNPLMMRDDTDFQPNYEPSDRNRIPQNKTPQHQPPPVAQTAAGRQASHRPPSSSESDSSDSSDDSMNPYD